MERESPAAQPSNPNQPSEITHITGNVSTGGGDFIGRDQIINNIVQGMGDLPTRYDGLVRNFLDYYLGSAERPAPFGGRAADLTTLDRWLADPKAPPYTLLAAPAGRGKSALLAHWVARLAARDDVHVVYFPISIRFNTNRDSVIFAALAARLAHIYGEKMTRAADAHEYRGVVTDYLRRTPPDGKPVLVVLDGLDEAAGWEVGADLFPLIPAGHLLVVVAARLRVHDPGGQGWLSQLGWDAPGVATTLALARLDRAGVADVLVQMSNPLDKLAANFDVVAKLYELSEGDPLLVRLYIETLLPLGTQAVTFRPDELLTLKPGLKAFFDRWFDEQKRLWSSNLTLAAAARDRAVNGLLNLCALAKGPLSRDDVLALALPELPDTATLDWATDALNRFVIGDGSLEAGYVFSHPRLAYYFADRLAERERTAWRDRFLHYGQETLAALKSSALKPVDAPPYAVRYYGIHLDDAQASPATLYALVCEGWLRAWEWVEGTPDGFLSDVQRAWAAAGTEGAPALGQIVRAALCFASVASVSAHIDFELLEACVKAGIISPQLALVMARTKPRADDRATCLAAISNYLSTDLRQTTLTEALNIVRTLSDGWRRATPLTVIATRLPPSEQQTVLAEALTAARAIDDGFGRARSLCAIAVYLPPVEQENVLAEALAAVRSIWSNEGSRATMLREITAAIPTGATALLTEALATARTLSDRWDRAAALSTIAARLPPVEQENVLAEALAATPHTGDSERATEMSPNMTGWSLSDTTALLTEVLATAHTIHGVRERALALSAVAVWLPPEGYQGVWAAALAAARAIRDEGNWRALALREIVAVVPPDAPALLAEVLAAVRAIGHKLSRAGLLRKLAARLPPNKQQHLLAEALTAARIIGDEESRAVTLSEVASLLSSDGQPPVLAEALAIARTIGDKTRHILTLAHISAKLPSAEQHAVLAEILAVDRTIDDEAKRGVVLQGFAEWLSPEAPALCSEVLAVLHATFVEARRADLLCKLAARLPPIEQQTVLAEALAVARTTGNEEHRARTLSEIATRLPPDEQQKVLAEALAIARTIGSKPVRVWALYEVAAQLPPVEQQNVLVEALAVARTIDNYWSRASALYRIVAAISPDTPALLAEVLAAAHMIGIVESRVSALSTVAARLPPNEQQKVLAEALAIARTITNTEGRVRALIAIATQLPPNEQQTVLAEALAITRTIDSEGSRGSALCAMAQGLPPDAAVLQREVLNELCALPHAETSVSILVMLAPYWTKMCLANDLSEVGEVTNVLRVFAKARRETLLRVILALASVIARLGGERAVRETAQAIIDTGKWWP